MIRPSIGPTEPNRGSALLLTETPTTPEIWADGGVLTDDGEVVRIAFFAKRHRGAGQFKRMIVLHMVMPPAGFAWTLQGALLLPVAQQLLRLAQAPPLIH